MNGVKLHQPLQYIEEFENALADRNIIKPTETKLWETRFTSFEFRQPQWVVLLPNKLYNAINNELAKKSLQLWLQLPLSVRNSYEHEQQLDLLDRVLRKGEITVAQVMIVSDDPARLAVEVSNFELIALLGKYKFFRGQEYLLTLDGVAEDKKMVEALLNAGITAELGSQRYYIEKAMHEENPERLRFYINRLRRFAELDTHLLGAVKSFKNICLGHNDARIGALGSQLDYQKAKKLGFQGFRRLAAGMELNRSIEQPISMILRADAMRKLEINGLGNPDAFQKDLWVWRENAVRSEDRDLFDTIAWEVWGREFVEHLETENLDFGQPNPLELLVQQLVTQTMDGGGTGFSSVAQTTDTGVLSMLDHIPATRGNVVSSDERPPAPPIPQIEEIAALGDQETIADVL